MTIKSVHWEWGETMNPAHTTFSVPIPSLVSEALDEVVAISGQSRASWVRDLIAKELSKERSDVRELWEKVREGRKDG